MASYYTEIEAHDGGFRVRLIKTGVDCLDNKLRRGEDFRVRASGVKLWLDDAFSDSDASPVGRALAIGWWAEVDSMQCPSYAGAVAVSMAMLKAAHSK